MQPGRVHLKVFFAPRGLGFGGAKRLVSVCISGEGNDDGEHGGEGEDVEVEKEEGDGEDMEVVKEGGEGEDAMGKSWYASVGVGQSIWMVGVGVYGNVQGSDTTKVLVVRNVFGSWKSSSMGWSIEMGGVGKLLPD